MEARIRAILACLAWATSTVWAQEPARAPEPAWPQPAAGRSEPGAKDEDAVDAFIKAQMERRRIPGLSLAIIQDGRIVKARGYGVTEAGGGRPVTASTLFQAGSISKPVSAMGALHLVERGKLALDEDVNAKLAAWKVPENDFTRQKKVTLRGLLSHTAGTTVHGFPGYPVGEAVPTLAQVLDGAHPANTKPIRVDILPGSQWRYSGGGYTIMQQLVVDVAGEPFPRYMQEVVLGPLGMQESTFEQPPPAEKAKLTATGHLADRSPVKGRWHIYPEMAAAGLWTTASDLARFAIGVQEAASGKSGRVLSQPMARRMLTVEKGSYGLGGRLQGSGTALRFSHGGRDAGFDALLIAFAEKGPGAVIMINVNDNSMMVPRILNAIAREYRWPDYPLSPPERPAVEVAADRLAAYAGRYEFASNRMLAFAVERGRLATLADGLPDEALVSEGDDRFASPERKTTITFLEDGDGEITGFHWKEGDREGKAPRIGPLFHSLQPQADPDPARTEKVVAALEALARGGEAIAEASFLTPGARADFGDGPDKNLAALRSVTFLAEQDVSSRGIERHKGAVSRILHYRLATDKAERGLLVHLTADGLMADYDIVED
jgi:CubicO group peptidase (beta-lactamase class C family)